MLYKYQGYRCKKGFIGLQIFTTDKRYYGNKDKLSIRSQNLTHKERDRHYRQIDYQNFNKTARNILTGYGLRLTVYGFRLTGYGFMLTGQGFMLTGQGFRLTGLGFRLTGNVFRLTGNGFRWTRYWFKLIGYG